MTDQTKAYRDLLFGIRRSVRYHSRRRQHYEFFHKSVLFLALVLGFVTVAAFADAIGAEWDTWMKALPAAAVSVLAALDLVIGTTTKSWQHADLLRQFIELERDMQLRSQEPLDDLVREITGRRLQIEASEPPVLRVLDTICHNEQLRSMGYKPEDEVKVGIFQRLFAPLFDLAEWRLHSNH